MQLQQACADSDDASLMTEQADSSHFGSPSPPHASLIASSVPVRPSATCWGSACTVFPGSQNASLRPSHSHVRRVKRTSLAASEDGKAGRRSRAGGGGEDRWRERDGSDVAYCDEGWSGAERPQEQRASLTQRQGRLMQLQNRWRAVDSRAASSAHSLRHYRVASCRSRCLSSACAASW